MLLAESRLRERSTSTRRADDFVKTRLNTIATLVRVSLIAAAASWWALAINICATVPQPDLRGGRTIPINCPGNIAFITPLQRMLLYGLVPTCVVLVVVDVLIKRHRSRD